MADDTILRGLDKDFQPIITAISANRGEIAVVVAVSAFYTSAESLFQCLPLFEPLEYSFAAEMKTEVVAVGRVSLNLHLDI